MSEALCINRAAKVLNKTPSTLRRWIQKGAPTVKLGSVGRDNGSLVNIADLQRWRSGGHAAASDDERLQFIATVLMDAFKRDEIHLRIGITARDCAGLLALVYERYHKNLLREPLDSKELPPEIEQLCTIWVE
ncbi:MAG TPA: hypothetical protein DD641_00820 [Deltaproteobacteria bacterium]|nr:hypothetical protein [Deltaproteobacteria bacterium]